tara:strand:- start:408 stop:677 length:270 start_codon:yes stop_codon:yes gene_type:complete
MVYKKKIQAFDDSILELHPELKKFLKPNDKYPELAHILKNRFFNLPVGSLNTKVIINDGIIVERIFKTPMGQVISLFPKPTNAIFDQVA